MLHTPKCATTTNLAHELVNHINDRLEILFNTVQTRLTNGLTKRTLLNDIDSIGAEINRYLNECDKNKFDRPCKYFLRGKCWFGDSCWYRHHTLSLLRPSTPQPKKVVRVKPQQRTFTPPATSQVKCQPTSTKPTLLGSTVTDVTYKRSSKPMPYWQAKQLAAYTKKVQKSAAQKVVFAKQQRQHPTVSPRGTAQQTKQQPPNTSVTYKSPRVPQTQLPPKNSSTPQQKTSTHEEKEVVNWEKIYEGLKVWKEQHKEVIFDTYALAYAEQVQHMYEKHGKKNTIIDDIKQSLRSNINDYNIDQVGYRAILKCDELKTTYRLYNESIMDDIVFRKCVKLDLFPSKNHESYARSLHIISHCMFYESDSDEE